MLDKFFKVIRINGITEVIIIKVDQTIFGSPQIFSRYQLRGSVVVRIIRVIAAVRVLGLSGHLEFFGF